MLNPGSWSAPAQPPATPTRRSERPDPETTLADTQRRTALPPALFGGCQAEVEARLSQGAGDLLLRHLACEGGADDLTDAPEESSPDQRATDDEAIAELLGRLSEPVEDASPSLDHGLAAERAHVLADLAASADGHARQSASRRLSDLIGDPEALGEIGADRLGELVAGIAGLPGDGAGACILLQVLRMAATKVLGSVEELDVVRSPQSAVEEFAS